MRVSKTIIGEGWLKKVTKPPLDPEVCGKSYTDNQCRGLVIWIAKDGVASFTFRIRIGGKHGTRVFERLGTYSSAFTLADARNAANVRRSEITSTGTTKKREEAPFLRDAIPKYEDARKKRDKQASRKGAPLPEEWSYHIGRFQKVFADLLPQRVCDLTRRDFVDAMAAYGVEWERQKGKEWKDRVLRPMMVCVMPMLRWFTKAGQRWIDAEEIEDLVPEDYDPDKRYLLPGEWQASAPQVDALEDDLGLFIRFLLATCTRSEQALCMQWKECQWNEPWLAFEDEEGREHEALIWIVPRDKKEGRMKGRGKGGAANKLPNRVLLTGDALVVLKRLRAIWQEGQKDPANAGYDGVFTRDMKTAWRSARSSMQRDIERAAGTATWDRMTLRHTHSTYLTMLGCPGNLVTLSMAHTPSKDGAAPITARYVGPVARRRFMTNDALAALAPWHLRLHKLFRDMERGHQSVELQSIQADLERDQSCADMLEEKKIAHSWIKTTPHRLTVVA